MVLSGQQTIAHALKAEGVEHMFGIPGGFTFMPAEAARLGIKLHIVRHEQTAGFAADGYGRSARKPGVVFTSVINGFANTVPAVLHAKGAQSPVVFLACSQGRVADGLHASQEGSPVDLVQGFTKWSHKVGEPSMISYWVRKAMRDSVTYPCGPVVLDFPANVHFVRDAGEQLKYIAADQVPYVPQTAANPVDVQKIVEILLQAKRPVIVAGDGVYWSDAAAELVELAELLQIPVSTKRTARGALPENHALAWTNAYRRGFLEHADAVCLIGIRVTHLDSWFEPPDWPEAARYLQIQEVVDDVYPALPTAAAAVGTSKLVLRQMIDCARSMAGTPSQDRTAWVETLQAAKKRRAQRQREEVERLRQTRPIHPHVLGQELVDFLDPTATLMYDSLTMSGFLTDKVESRFAGSVLDAGLFQTLGHSVGMAIGAQVARPGRQVVSVIGDGGVGISGMDLETMAREKLPVVTILFNNSSWGGRVWGKDQWYTPAFGAHDMLPNLRYDQMFEHFGCHGEFVTDADQLRPALERAFNAGRPALLNVIGDADAVMPFRAAINLLDTWATGGPAAPITEEARAQMRTWGPGMVERAQRRGRDMIFGKDIPLQELAEAAGIQLEAARQPEAARSRGKK